MAGETRSNPSFGAMMGVVSGLAVVFMMTAGKRHDAPPETASAMVAMVECFASPPSPVSPGCYPKPSAQLSQLEADATVLKYAREGRCEEMHGRANRACLNVFPR